MICYSFRIKVGIMTLTQKTIGRQTEWHVEKKPVPYAQAVSLMEDRVRDIRDSKADDLVWLLEHPPLYTAGTSARAEDLLRADLPVHQTGRGGQYTYHGPGQRVAYVMMDLHRRGSDLRCYISDLEEWVIRALRDFGVTGERRPGRVGVWVADGKSEAKIAAVGVRVRKWVAYHGVSVNVNPDLSHYAGIIACGVKDHGVTSLRALGVQASLADVDRALQKGFFHVFG